MEIKNTIKISAPITPYDDQDQYPTHYANYGCGGYHVVNSIDERDDIPMTRREIGMLVFVNDENRRWYTLQDGFGNSNWVDYAYVINGSKGGNIIVSDTEPEDPKKTDIWLNPLTGSFLFFHIKLIKIMTHLKHSIVYCVSYLELT